MFFTLEARAFRNRKGSWRYGIDGELSGERNVLVVRYFFGFLSIEIEEGMWKTEEKIGGWEGGVRCILKGR